MYQDLEYSLHEIKRAFRAADLLRQYPIANGPRSPWTIASSEYSLAVEQRHLFFHITRAVNDILGADLIDSFEILLHEKDISRGRIFPQVLDTLRTRDRQRPVGNRPLLYPRSVKRILHLCQLLGNRPQPPRECFVMRART